MVNLPENFYELVVKCKEYCEDSNVIDRKKINNEDIHDSAVFVVFLRLGGMLDEAQSNYLIKVVEEDDKLLNKEYILQTPFSKWSNGLLKLIESERKIEQSPNKLATLGIIKPSTNPEAPIRRLYNDLFNILEYIKNKPLNKEFINNLEPAKDGDLVAEFKTNVNGIGFTKATLFCYGLGLANNFSAVSNHVKSFVNDFIKSDIDMEDYYVINFHLKDPVLKNFQTKEPKIIMRHIDLAIYTLYVSRGQLFLKQKKNRITPRIILDWMKLKNFSLDKFLAIIADLDEIEKYSEEFTDFALARI